MTDIFIKSEVCDSRHKKPYTAGIQFNVNGNQIPTKIAVFHENFQRNPNPLIYLILMN